MHIRLAWFVETHTTTKFDTEEAARQYAAAVNGKVRRPVETKRNDLAGKLYQALVDMEVTA